MADVTHILLHGLFLIVPQVLQVLEPGIQHLANKSVEQMYCVTHLNYCVKCSILLVFDNIMTELSFQNFVRVDLQNVKIVFS